MYICRKTTRRLLQLTVLVSHLLLTITQPIVNTNPPTGCIENGNFKLLNNWSSLRVCSTPNSNSPEGRLADAIAAYQRGPAHAPLWQQDNEWRIVIYGGFDRMTCLSNDETWTYFPDINSWTLLSLEIRPPSRYGHTLTSLCTTTVILVGGRNCVNLEIFNDTWLFDGVTETWYQLDVKVVNTNEFMRPRHYHAAVAVSQPLSNCTCKESIIVYGGLFNNSKTLGDMWELRCMADFDHEERFYWIKRGPHTTGDSLWPKGRRESRFAAIRRDLLYMWGGRRLQSFSFDFWQYNITSGRWKILARQETRLPPTTIVGTFYFAKVSGLIALSFGKYSYVVKLSDGGHYYEVIRVLNRKEYYDPGLALVLDDTIFCISYYGQTTSVYKIAYLENWAFFEWTLTFIPDTTPVIRQQKSRQFAVLNNNCYIFSYYVNGVSTWQFKISSQVWFQTWSRFSPGDLSHATVAAINNSLIAVYSPCPSCDYDRQSGIGANIKVTTSDIWIYNRRFRRWTLCVKKSNKSESRYHVARTYATMTSMRNGSLLLYGGIKYSDSGKALNDLWRIDVCHQNNHIYSPVRVDCVRWVLLSNNIFGVLYPTARYSHAAYVYNNSLFIFGGIHTSTNSNSASNNSQSFMLSDMWQFHIETKQWSKVVQNGPIPGVPCRSTAIIRLETKVVIAGSSKGSASSRNSLFNCSSPALYSFDVTSNAWAMLADAPPRVPVLFTSWNHTLLAMTLSYFKYFSFDRTFYSHAYDSASFASLVPACPAGQYSKKWENDTCKKCDVGEYAPVGAASCSSCPEGLTTIGNNRRLSDCVCRLDYCKNGKCLNVTVADAITAYCDCDFGYTGKTCLVPTYYLIGSSVVGVTLLVVALVHFVARTTKYRKAKKLVEEELSSAHKVWTIHCDEIKLHERIDEDTPGSYGEVYKAMYRDIPVAVKYLSAVMFTDSIVRKEFEREVVVMRGIRHPNIVMFFGAGTVQNQENENVPRYPFLVVELMARGTLKKILDTPGIEINYNRQVTFALDASRGMQYLHGLSPPRIHRDVKSCNLLVSQSWVVKVADFGSARAVKREGERQLTDIASVHQQQDDMNICLVQADYLLTRDTGTLLWRAPEVFARERYGTSADVYSFGIVLWEILCRDDPYKDHKFKWMKEVSRSVQSGKRPTIPPSSPPLYVTLMKDCWNTDPDCRPSFTQIVDRLVLISNITPKENEEATTRM